MIVERSMHDQFLSNTYLVAEGEGGSSFFIDAGGPVRPLIEAAERLGVEPTHVLLTHHHYDHVCELDEITRRWPRIEVLIDPAERELAAGGEESSSWGEIEGGADMEIGRLRVKALATPGHTVGMLSFLVSDPESVQEGVFTGDTLFKGSVGGVRAPGHGTYEQLKESIMETLLALPPGTTIYPGHTQPTSVADELQTNPFVRVWRGLDQEGDGECIALGEPATLVLLSEDYDGGKKAWVRWMDGADDIVPGSKVQVHATS
jgi:glyoxylase-like metal-dependent hydrolase (beta-lactamase superfamily II)